MLVILNVDPMMKNEPSFLLDHGCHQGPGLLDGMIMGGSLVGQVLALIIRDIDVIDEVEVESRHGSGAPRPYAAFRALTQVTVIWPSADIPG